MTKRPTPKRQWEPMYRCELLPWTPAQREAVHQVAAANDKDEDWINQHNPDFREAWKNDRYLATVDRRDDGSVEHISIHRHDRKPLHDWRDLQRLKNDIAGEEIEAVEIYPAQSRLVDTTNEYHLWCFVPGYVLPIGFATGNLMLDDPEPFPNARQRTA